MPDYKWPPKEKRTQIGKRVERVDGLEKASGKAKYGSDVKPAGLIYAALLTSPHAHARVKSVDTSAAQSVKGVTAVHVISGPGTEIQWAGTEIAAVAAETEEAAKDAVRHIKVDYEVLPHVVREDDLSKVGSRAKQAGERLSGDPDKAFQEADAVSEGFYGLPVIYHATLETHGSAVEWKGDKMNAWASTQYVAGWAPEVAKALQIPAANIHVHQDHVGGGFGSKFTADRWSVVAAHLSKASGGRPVRLFLDRATDVSIAGNRPSAFAKIKIAGKNDGTITAWQSESWASGGFGGGGMPPIPYVFTEIPNRRLNHTAVSLNAGPSRAWRAPNHPQASFLTCCAMDDLAAKLKMDPLDLFMKNADYTARAAVYRQQLQKAAELMDWKKRWHQRGDSGSGPVKRGLGLGVGTWAGAGHASQCRAMIHPDGGVEIEICTQDLGTGTRTIMTQVVAESLGLPLNAIRLKIGDNQYPPSGASGGSTTVGGVSSSSRKATLNALEKLFEVVAPSLGVPPDQLEAGDGEIRVKGNGQKRLTWKAACQKLGTRTISEMGENNPRSPEGLNTGGVGGAQMADVSVDTETGLVKMHKLVAVHDCGMIINPKTAESQIYGACTMAIGGALYEERIMDPATGRVLNPNMEFCKFTRIGDYGEIVPYLCMDPEHDQRGVVGLGEPPVIPGIAAIANAVANAIGVRVPMIPFTPERVLAALERRNA
ncbi:MAG: xanthine dehydrogenase family protein molybdopterin-binding subunit [Acidobacteria bacterium]|nr:xanthine dehydrogenase family protein molybdopterin-binding subunit [Acidobacteriota bacterium]